MYGLSIELNFFCLWPLSLFSVVLSICYVTVAFLMLQHAYVELVKLSSKKNGANFNTATLLKKKCVFWAETLKHVSFCSNIEIHPCLITPSNNLYLINREKIQRIHVSYLFFKVPFICLESHKWHPWSIERLSFILRLVLVKAGGMSENLVNVLYCGLLVQKAGRLSFNSVVNEYPRGNSLWTGSIP